MPALDAPSANRLTTAGGKPVGVDRKNNVLRGYVVAMHGPFKSQGRGQFDSDSLNRIVMLGNAWSQGLKSRFHHPNECNDSLGSFLGRARGFYLSVATRYDGEKVPAVRANLHFDPTALKEPPRGGGRPLGLYVMDLAESDPDALSSSLVLRPLKIKQLDDKGKPKLDADGNELPPIWLPRSLSASDFVDTGDAVDGVLSGGLLGSDSLSELRSLLDGSRSGLSGVTVAAASSLLDRLFEGRSRKEVEARIHAFANAYIDRRFGR